MVKKENFVTFRRETIKRPIGAGWMKKKENTVFAR